MKSYLVLGLGRFGRSFAQTLAEHGCDVLGVDKNNQVVQEMSDIVTHVICAESSNEEFLRSIGVTNFDAAVVAMGGNIQASVLTTVLLKELGARYILAKAQNDLHAKVLYKVGADRVVFPERDMGIKTANNMISARIIDIIELSPEYSIMEITIPTSWIGKTIGELAIRAKYGVNVLAIKRGATINASPNAEARFQQNDIAAVMGKNSDLKNLQNMK